MTPAEYTYTLPDGYTLEQPFRGKLDALVEEAVMSNELAQKFVDLHIELTEDFIQRFKSADRTTEIEEKTKALKAVDYTPESTPT